MQNYLIYKKNRRQVVLTINNITLGNEISRFNNVTDCIRFYLLEIHNAVRHVFATHAPGDVMLPIYGKLAIQLVKASASLKNFPCRKKYLLRHLAAK